MVSIIKSLVKILAPDSRIGRSLLRVRMFGQCVALQFSGVGGEDGKDFLDVCRRVIPRYSMVSVDRLYSLYQISLGLARRQIRGSIVECGTWNGGAAAVMAHASIRGGIARNVWLFDSFEGLPAPTADDPTAVHQAYHPGWCTGSPQMAKAALMAEGVEPDSIHIVKGWFKQTLPTANLGPIVLLHIDSDWYESVRICLETFYDSVVPGGVIVLDDYYCWSGCRKAIDEFVTAKGLSDALKPSGKTAVFLTKPIS
jgi:hypothetical protein